MTLRELLTWIADNCSDQDLDKHLSMLVPDYSNDGREAFGVSEIEKKEHVITFHYSI